MSKLSSSIDSIVNAQYIGITKFGELAQLAKLFDANFVANVARTLSKNVQHPKNATRQFEISFGWIDKRPLAEFTSRNVIDHNGNTVTEKVELGDLALIHIEEQGFIANGKFKARSASAYSALIQAKKSSKTALPSVPVGYGKAKNNSTAKELVLLSNWPEFNLYATSGNQSSILQNVKLAGPDAKKYGWYMACPPATKNWRSRWMCAPATLSDLCDVSFGELLEAFVLRSKVNNMYVGEVFTLSNSYINSSMPWDSVSNAILSLCKKYRLPSHLFPSTSNRVVTSGKILSLFANTPLEFRGCGNSSCKRCYDNWGAMPGMELWERDESWPQITHEGFPVLLVFSRTAEG